MNTYTHTLKISHTQKHTHTHSFPNTRTQTHMCVYTYRRHLLRASMHPHPQHHAQVIGVPASHLCCRHRPWRATLPLQARPRCPPNVPPDGPPDNPNRLPASVRVTMLSKRGRPLRATFSCSTCSRGVRPRAAMHQPVVRRSV